MFYFNQKLGGKWKEQGDEFTRSMKTDIDAYYYTKQKKLKYDHPVKWEKYKENSYVDQWVDFSSDQRYWNAITFATDTFERRIPFDNRYKQWVVLQHLNSTCDNKSFKCTKQLILSQKARINAGYSCGKF